MLESNRMIFLTVKDSKDYQQATVAERLVSTGFIDSKRLYVPTPWLRGWVITSV